MFDELVRPPDLHHWRSNSFLIEQLQYGAAITTHKNMVLERYQHVRSASKKFRRSGIQRFDEARINDGHVKTLGGQLCSRFAPKIHHVTQTEKRDLAATAARKILNDFGFADFD